ncbi:MAG: hypothetical protein V4543_06790 [Bacteroidota bacterium]
MAKKPVVPVRPMASARITEAPAVSLYPDSQSNKPVLLSPRSLLILTLLFAAAYFIFSFSSAGLYQQDEAAHFVSMLSFWHNPNIALSNWAKPGYKVLYALPVLGGRNTVTLVNCLFSAFTCYFTYRAAEKRGVSNPLIAFVILALQPFWFMLAFRNYSEIPTAFLISLALFLHTSRKRFFAALCISYICTMRQEFIPIAGMYGLYLLGLKSWLPALSLAIFPLLQNVWGWSATGDPIWLYNQVFNSSADIKEAYPRQGFAHYFQTSIVVFGPVAVALFIANLFSAAFNKRLPDLLIVVPAIAYLLLNSLFQWQEVHIGPSTGGNLRYMLVIAPFVSIAAAAAFDEFKALDKKWALLLVMIPLLVIVATYMNYKHNYVILTEETDTKPTLGVLITLIALYIPMNYRTLTAAFGVIVLFFGLLNIRPKKMAEEDRTCKEMANYYLANEEAFSKRQLYVNHSMFYFWLGRSSYDFAIPPIEISDDAQMTKAKAGSLIFWDSHYSYRPHLKRGLNHEYFDTKPDTYRETYRLLAPDRTFAVITYDKLK